jgi:hypothetical protein
VEAEQKESVQSAQGRLRRKESSKRGRGKGVHASGACLDTARASK